MLKSHFDSGIKLGLLLILFVFSVSGCANTSFKIIEQNKDTYINREDKILLVVTSINYDFAKFVRDDVYDGLQKKNFNILKYSDILSAVSINKDENNISDFCKEHDIKYIIKLEGITCVEALGYMPPSQKIETYSYYSNGKMQTGTKTVSVPGYNYTYLQAYLSINILDADTEDSLVKINVTTTGSMSALKSKISKSMANKITNKIVRMVKK